MIPYLALCRQVISLCTAKSLKLTAAESCTGGLLIGGLTEVSGASAVIDRGFITYSNEAKKELLGIPASMLATSGAVSEPVARAMAEGALWASRADIAIAITGIAGPGGSEYKPEGLVHIACALRKGPANFPHEKHQFGPLGRFLVRQRSVEAALTLAIANI
jgi:nicotinamide-nucleotide amidase